MTAGTPGSLAGNVNPAETFRYRCREGAGRSPREGRREPLPAPGEQRKRKRAGRYPTMSVAPSAL